MKIAPIIPNHLLDSIQVNSPLFVQFMTDYYSYMETGVGSPQYILQNMLNIIEKDAKNDLFFSSIFEKINPTGLPSTVAIDPKLLTLAMQQIYRTKGSETSYGILFRILFGTAVEIYYPKFRMIRSSDGKWEQNQSILVDIGNSVIADITNRVLKCVNRSGSITSKIIRYTRIKNNIYEIFIDSINRNINFEYLDVVTVPGTSFSGRVQRTIVQCNVVNGGLGFRVGQIFNVYDNLGTGTTVKVNIIGPLGQIKKVTIVSFGIGYEQPFRFTIRSPVTQSDMSNPFVTYTNGFIESGEIRDNAGNVLRKFYDDASIIEGGVVDTTKSAIISAEIGALCKYPGYYTVSDGMLSDYGVLQDGNLFQEYSYLIKSEIPVDQYRDAVQDILHPAGTKMFGEYELVNDIDLGVALELVRDIVRALAITTDFTTPSDIYSISVIKGIDEIVTSSESVTIVYDATYPNENVINTDNGYVARSDYVVSGYFPPDYVSDIILTF